MKAKSLIKARENKYFYLFISPWIIGFLLFTGGPILMSIFYSFTQYNIADPPVFVGAKNYSQLFNDPLFWKSAKVTLYYTLLAVPLGLVLSLLTAMLVNVEIPGQRFFRTIIYLPSIISGVALSLLWLWMLNPQLGVLNFLIYKLTGQQGPQWLLSEEWVIPSLVMMSLWGIGPNMVIYLAGLKGVPSSLYEAADIDGASKFSKFIHITVPMVSPATLFLLITGIIGTFQVFVQAQIMTQGGPNYASFFFVYFLYQQAFGSFNMGYASAMAWILFVVVLLLTWLMMSLSKRWVHYEGGNQ
ncbi:ABC transporter permease [Bacillus sp. SA1-12]|uniref:carbohydrate ABC transporter permease n=1 Tax=Bacillus sp. SA1-12 TaxID=1455638 RepID=UPI000627337A|nr:sugar ABC transporter permease [Bacillus sp. SA1-12]KKI89750.1 ABC transporter permease [Bacillus sp. SA1-12]